MNLFSLQDLYFYLSCFKKIVKSAGRWVEKALQRNLSTIYFRLSLTFPDLTLNKKETFPLIDCKRSAW